MNASMSRREFLKAGGALIVCSSSFPESGALAQTAAGKPPLLPTELDSWIAILPDGRVNAFFGKMDMGQGLDIAVAQIVAEELDVGFDKVDVLMGDTATSCNQGGASGSTGVSNGARLLRRPGCTRSRCRPSAPRPCRSRRRAPPRRSARPRYPGPGPYPSCRRRRLPGRRAGSRSRNRARRGRAAACPLPFAPELHSSEMRSKRPMLRLLSETRGAT